MRTPGATAGDLHPAPAVVRVVLAPPHPRVAARLQASAGQCHLRRGGRHSPHGGASSRPAHAFGLQPTGVRPGLPASAHASLCRGTTGRTAFRAPPPAVDDTSGQGCLFGKQYLRELWRRGYKSDPIRIRGQGPALNCQPVFASTKWGPRTNDLRGWVRGKSLTASCAGPRPRITAEDDSRF